MNLWFRLLRIYLLSSFAPKARWDETTELTFRVWPTDLDTNIHMNNARYLALMDLGRLNMMMRGDLWAYVRRERLMPVLAGSLVRFRRSLGPFTTLKLRSTFIGWDEKWLFIEHRMESNGELACLAVMKAAFLAAGKPVPPDEIAKAVGHDGQRPILPEWIAAWQNAERAASRGSDKA